MTKRRLEPRDNYGAFRTRAVAHADRPSNWFRKAARPKATRGRPNVAGRRVAFE